MLGLAAPAASAVLAVLTDDGHAQVLNDDTVSPGLVGSAVVAVLIIAVVFLLRSFLKQLRKVPPDDPADGPAAPPGAEGPSDAQLPT